MGYMNRQGNYYEGDMQFGDVEYAEPPGPLPDYEPDGNGGWRRKPVPVPLSVTPLQARRALLAAGKLDAVSSAVAVADQDTKLAWDYATSVERGSSFVASLAAAIGLTDAQVDDLFRTAATLN